MHSDLLDTGSMASADGSPGSLDDGPQSAAKRVKLTAAQRRERKRKLDREAQRAVREKTKNHITYLEGLVKALQNPEGNDARVQELVTQIESGHEEVKQLREALGNIGKIVSGVAKAGGDDPVVKSEDRGPPGGDVSLRYALATPSNTPPGADSMGMGTSGMPHGSALLAETHPTLIDEPCYGSMDDDPYAPDHHSIGGNSVSTGADAFTSVPSSMPDAYSTAMVEPGQAVKTYVDTGFRFSNEDLDDNEQYWGSYSLPTLTSDNAELAQLRRVIQDTVNTILTNPSLKTKYWYVAGLVLQHLLARPDMPLTPRHMDEDIAIRACLHGWQAVEKQYVLDGGWHWLKVLDTHMYSHLGFPERMAILRIKRTKFLCQMRPSRFDELKLPNFMKPRPAQEHVQHDALVEYFVWPGMREHLLFSPITYTTDAFMEPFRQNLHFLWPHEAHDMYNRDPVTGTYRFSDLWTHHMSHIGCWRINADFFELFPHLRPDIPCATEDPASSQALIKKSVLDARRMARTDGSSRGSVSLFGERDEEEHARNEDEFCGPNTLAAAVPVNGLLSFTE